MHHVDNGHDLTSHTAITRNSSTVTSFQISSPKFSSIEIQNHLDMSFMMSNSETPHLDPTSNLQQSKQSSRKNPSKTQPNLPPQQLQHHRLCFPNGIPETQNENGALHPRPWRQTSVLPQDPMIDSKVQLVDCPTVSSCLWYSTHISV